jgi:hypothetical protein
MQLGIYHHLGNIMEIKGESGPHGFSFYVKPTDFNWSLSIRRVDDRKDNQFSEFHNTFVPVAFLVSLIPDWNSLEWTKINTGLGTILAAVELTAKSGAYKLAISIATDADESTAVAQFNHMLCS